MNSEDKILVNDYECEKMVIGTLLNNKSVIYDIQPLLTSECFYDGRCREIWDTISSVAEKGDVVDIINVNAELQKRGSSVNFADLMYFSDFNALYDIESKVLRLKDLCTRRNLWKVGNMLLSAGVSEADDINIVRQQAMDGVDEVLEDTDGIITLSDAIRNLMQVVAKNISGDTEMTGTPTGFERFDRKGGLQGSDLIIVAGETSQGKTSFAVSIAKNAIMSGKKIAFYSMEMTNNQLSARILSAESGVSSSDILYNSNIDENNLKLIDAAIGKIKGENLFFDERSTSSIETILLSIRSMKMKHDIDGAIVDYLQILNVNMRNTNKEQAMGEASRRLKNLAKDLNIWIIALSQLSRDSSNPVPNLNRLRDSGQIAEAADMVVFVYRAETYNRPFPEPFENAETSGMAMIDVSKGRNIGTFKFLCRFNAPTTSFHDIRGEDPVPMREPENEREDGIMPF